MEELYMPRFEQNISDLIDLFDRYFDFSLDYNLYKHTDGKHLTPESSVKLSKELEQ